MRRPCDWQTGDPQNFLGLMGINVQLHMQPTGGGVQRLFRAECQWTSELNSRRHRQRTSPDDAVLATRQNPESSLTRSPNRPGTGDHLTQFAPEPCWALPSPPWR